MVQLTFKPGSVVGFGRAYRVGCSDLHRGTRFTHKPKSSARRQARRERKFLEVFANLMACLFAFALVEVAVINFLFFPECSRTTRDCFLIQHAWGAK